MSSRPHLDPSLPSFLLRAIAEDRRPWQHVLGTWSGKKGDVLDAEATGDWPETHAFDPGVVCCSPEAAEVIGYSSDGGPWKDRPRRTLRILSVRVRFNRDATVHLAMFGSTVLR